MNKTNPWLLLLLVATTLFIECREIETVTEVTRDQTCVRQVMVRADSSRIFDTPFPIPRDSTWHTSWEVVPEDSEKVQYTATRVFSNVAELSEYYNRRNDTIRIQIDLTKRFRWFFTYLVYTERYEPYSLFTDLDIRESFSNDELEILYSEQDCTAIEDRFENWEMKNIFEGFYQAMLAEVQENEYSELTGQMLKNSKDTLFAVIEHAGELDSILIEYEKILGTDEVWRLKNRLKNELTTIQNKLEYIGDVSGDEYIHRVKLPGLIVDTNAETVEANTASWEFDGERFQYIPLSTFVESRVVNLWTVWFSGIVAGGFVLLLMLSAFRRK